MTSAPWALDKELLARFGARGCTAIPDEEARKKILEMELVGPLLEVLPRLTEGFTGNDLQMLVEEAKIKAAIRATKRQEEEDPKEVDSSVELVDLEEALKRIRPSVNQTDLQRYQSYLFR